MHYVDRRGLIYKNNNTRPLLSFPQKFIWGNHEVISHMHIDVLLDLFHVFVGANKTPFLIFVIDYGHEHSYQNIALRIFDHVGIFSSQF